MISDWTIIDIKAMLKDSQSALLQSILSDDQIDILREQGYIRVPGPSGLFYDVWYPGIGSVTAMCQNAVHPDTFGKIAHICIGPRYYSDQTFASRMYTFIRLVTSVNGEYELFATGNMGELGNYANPNYSFYWTLEMIHTVANEGGTSIYEIEKAAREYVPGITRYFGQEQADNFFRVMFCTPILKNTYESILSRMMEGEKNG